MVKRYDFEAGGFLGSSGEMVESDIGDYVLVSDYNKIETAFVAQSRKLQAVLHVPGVKEILNDLEWDSKP